MHHSTLAVGILDDWTALGKDVRVLITVVVLGTIYVAAVAVTWSTSRSVVKAAVAAVGGALVLGVIASQPAISGKTAEEIKKDHTVGQGVVRLVDRPESAAAFLGPEFTRSGWRG
ncbi:hypothetical protein K388_06956 [Streptomyces sp. KhCrAH-43]|uniref:hypothetical protein n=1 Tax=unclassified Streptomyces TaxID=2593676 RepID=UPI000380F9E0|nr:MULTISPECIES: hypothetical protein [unclassified Streptomyces]MYS39644.1 hypothetical protein [Streptomyces sp. SID4920]MYX64324.1 hypothetical protein [Streptomyces sp. SID8373]RAJ48608.1 hypothetical protein K388_06956 [Streptomyces sp. KhCrAH-43]